MDQKLRIMSAELFSSFFHITVALVSTHKLTYYHLRRVFLCINCHAMSSETSPWTHRRQRFRSFVL